MTRELERRFVKNESMVTLDTLHPSNPTFMDITQITLVTSQYTNLGFNDLLKHEAILAKRTLIDNGAKCTDDVILQLLQMKAAFPNLALFCKLL